MNEKQFIDVVELAHADLAPYIPGLAGVAIIAFSWHDDHGLVVRMAANLPKDAVDLAIDMLHHTRDATRPDGTPPITEVRRTRLRKGV